MTVAKTIMDNYMIRGTDKIRKGLDQGFVSRANSEGYV